MKVINTYLVNEDLNGILVPLYECVGNRWYMTKHEWVGGHIVPQLISITLEEANKLRLLSEIKVDDITKRHRRDNDSI